MSPNKERPVCQPAEGRSFGVSEEKGKAYPEVHTL